MYFILVKHVRTAILKILNLIGFHDTITKSGFYFFRYILSVLYNIIILCGILRQGSFHIIFYDWNFEVIISEETILTGIESIRQSIALFHPRRK